MSCMSPEAPLFTDSNLVLGPIRDRTSKASLLNLFGSWKTFTRSRLSHELYCRVDSVADAELLLPPTFPVIQIKFSL